MRPKPTDDPFPCNLRALRHEAGLTQRELAFRAGLVRRSSGTGSNPVYRFEQGLGNPTLRTLARLATALRVPLVRLVGPALAPEPVEVVVEDAA